jgi:ABC-2 type transport system ATP-binding protein
VTILLTTQNLHEAERLCQQVGVIRNGKLLALGSVEELRMSSGKPRAVITGSGFSEMVLAELRRSPDVVSTDLSGRNLTIEFSKPVEIAPIVSMLVSKGALVEEVRKGQASLEDVFLTLVQEEQEVES